MTLYDFLKQEDTDFDTYDLVFDACVTVCVPEKDSKELDWYDKFYNLILKHVDVKEKIDECTATVDWYKFIEANIEVFKDITNETWYIKYDRYDDDDDFIYDWITELDGLLAGNGQECVYKWIVEIALIYMVIL